jgi:hypothetical protein
MSQQDVKLDSQNVEYVEPKVQRRRPYALSPLLNDPDPARSATPKPVQWKRSTIQLRLQLLSGNKI